MMDDKQGLYRIGGSRIGQLFLSIDDPFVRVDGTLDEPRFKSGDVVVSISGETVEFLRLDEARKLKKCVLR